MKDKISVVIKEPGKPFGIHRVVKNTLESLQEIVGGYIEVHAVDDDTALVCNEEGLIKGLPLNGHPNGMDIYGTYVLVGTDGENFTDYWLWKEKET